MSKKIRRTKLSNWTRFPVIEAELTEPAFCDDVIKEIDKKERVIARGNGRCYGDASLNVQVLSTLKLNKILAFDPMTGIIEVQSGILLSDILDFIVPKGWFLPVTPGTKFITVGGAIASNVHGKNHHKEGSFSNFVESFELLQADHTIVEVCAQDNPELFDLTHGGMGLTGVVLSAKIRLKKIDNALIDTLNIKASNLEEVFELFQKHKDYTYSVAWIDCYQKGSSIGRSVLMLGEHASKEQVNGKESPKAHTSSPKPKLKMPMDLPNWALNGFTIRLFNFLYYHKQWKKQSKKLVHYEGFFYPLDSILEWNKLYGRRGFIQYQFVLPLEGSIEGLKVMLDMIRTSGYGSFLAVLKLFGAKDNEFSFPMEGYTLALDFPIKDGLFEFLDLMDEQVIKYGGRIYLSKDARMSRSTFETTYPQLPEVKSVLKKYNLGGKFESQLSKRLGLTE
ncbi:FAD-binding oxidoreductase [Reichenbachiella agarivorans]|uniref:FAD-binding oxidoreductase n=1 Tax=Reichenbachiella agarivorans TaxID=2979464 RepID=A0ABY6CPK8_9BACT|nr:FAD-binding oxidoreductase [Reichenbachiella agarivorans]UXP32427.1 FAD-binding oxidoreductase [Reichenbachiella agarivorans]